MTWRQWWRYKFYWRRRVGLTIVGNEQVSTVYISVPGLHIEKPYETMVFGDYDDGIQVRYRTRREAKVGHWKIVNDLRHEFAD